MPEKIDCVKMRGAFINLTKIDYRLCKANIFIYLDSKNRVRISDATKRRPEKALWELPEGKLLRRIDYGIVYEYLRVHKLVLKNGKYVPEATPYDHCNLSEYRVFEIENDSCKRSVIEEYFNQSKSN